MRSTASLTSFPAPRSTTSMRPRKSGRSVVPAYLLHHRLHAIQRAQQLHGLFRQVIQAFGGAHPLLRRQGGRWTAAITTARPAAALARRRQRIRLPSRIPASIGAATTGGVTRAFGDFWGFQEGMAPRQCPRDRRGSVGQKEVRVPTGCPALLPLGETYARRCRPAPAGWAQPLRTG
jgi:hypothetical protein